MDFIMQTPVKYIVILFVIFMSYFCNALAINLSSSKQSIVFRKIINQFEEEMKKELDLTPIGSGGRVHEKIEEFEIFFSVNKNFTINEARRLEICACECLLDIINNCKEAKEVLVHYPFTPQDITVDIGLNDQPGKFHNYQNLGEKLAVVTLIHSNILYKRCHPKKACYITVLKESFEEAAKIVHQTDIDR